MSEPRTNTTVRADGAGAIAVGGDAVNSIFVTGGVNQFFVGPYERLADAYLNPRALYRELQLDGFAGRAWLLQAIDDFLATSDRGYVVIEAEAGMGKTAFLAWMARERGYVHHFVRLMPDADDVGVALRSLSAQLIRAWDLQAVAVGGILPPSASRPDFFEELLYEAAEKRDATRPGEPIVITVDGLNETTPAVGQNPLALPAELPGGVYVVVTQRTVHVPLAVVAPRRLLRLRADSPENLADMRAYLDAAVAEPRLGDRLATVGQAPDDLVRQLVDRCAGVWLVLRYVLAELRSGARRADDLVSLPVGLWQYYAQFWLTWQRTHADTWSEIDLPLLVTLTAAEEPLSLELLCELSGGQDADRVATLVGDSWRPFLQVQEEPEERFAAFHDSLGEFVAGRVDLASLAGAERSFVGRLSAAERAAHERIADRFLVAWGGLRDGLPDLRGDAATMDDGYGVRHLVHHLVRSSADVVLHALMELEWPRDEIVDPDDSSPAANAWYEVHRTRRAFAGYALDVERAWALAEEAGDEPAAGTPRSIALELRYALVAASVNSVAGNVPADLLLLLIDDDLVTTAQGLELAREITDPRTRAEALTALAPRLSGERHSEAVREALASVQLVPDGYWRAGELTRLAPVAAAEHLEDLVRLADGMSRPYYRDIVLRRLDLGAVAPIDAPAGAALSSSVDPSDPEVFATQYRERTRQGVAALVAGAQLPGGADAHERVVASRFVRSSRWRAELLAASASTAPPEERGPVLRAALGVSLTVGDRDALGSTLASIAASLAEQGRLSQALACVAEVGDPEGLTRALFAVAARTAPPDQEDVTRRALAAAAGIGDPLLRSAVLHRHAAQLAGLVGDAALGSTLATLSDDWRASVQGAMAEAGVAPGTPGTAGRDEMFAEALATAASSHDVVGRARAITDLIPRLPLPLLATARVAVEAIDDSEQRDAAAAALAGRLGELGEATPADDVTALVVDPHWHDEARFANAMGLAAAGRRDEAADVAGRLASRPRQAEALAAAGRFGTAFDLADAAPDPIERVVLLLRIGSATGPPGSPGSPSERDAVDEAREALTGVTDPIARPQSVVAVAWVLAGRGRVDAALDLVRGLRDDERSSALLPLAPHVGGDTVGPAVALAREIGDPVPRARVLAALTAPLLAAGAADIQAHVREVLHLLAAGTRAELVEALPDLLPGLVELAGVQGLVDLAAAVAAAYRWWP